MRPNQCLQRVFLPKTWLLVTLSWAVTGLEVKHHVCERHHPIAKTGKSTGREMVRKSLAGFSLNWLGCKVECVFSHILALVLLNTV